MIFFLAFLIYLPYFNFYNEHIISLKTENLFQRSKENISRVHTFNGEKTKLKLE